MSKGELPGKFEHLVLLAILPVDPDAYMLEGLRFPLRGGGTGFIL